MREIDLDRNVRKQLVYKRNENGERTNRVSSLMGLDASDGTLPFRIIIGEKKSSNSKTVYTKKVSYIIEGNTVIQNEEILSEITYKYTEPVTELPYGGREPVPHIPLWMCNECYGLLRTDESEKFFAKKGNPALCSCKKITRGKAIKIDQNLFEVIQALNKKGFKTGGCCEGYFEDGPTICLDSVKWTYSQKKSFKKILPDYYLYRNIIATPKKYKNEEDEEKRKDLEKLLNWVNEQPEAIISSDN